MPSKNCPSCGFQFSATDFLKITSFHFRCPEYQSGLKTDLRLFILAAIIVAPILAFPISWAIKNPWMWLAVLGAMGLSFFVYYLLFSVKAEQPK